jgi:hypothetical protein
MVKEAGNSYFLKRCTTLPFSFRNPKSIDPDFLLEQEIESIKTPMADTV